MNSSTRRSATPGRRRPRLRRRPGAHARATLGRAAVGSATARSGALGGAAFTAGARRAAARRSLGDRRAGRARRAPMRARHRRGRRAALRGVHPCRLLPGQRGDQFDEVFAPLLEVPVLVEAGAGRAEQHDVAGHGVPRRRSRRRPPGRRRTTYGVARDPTAARPARERRARFGAVAPMRSASLDPALGRRAPARRTRRPCRAAEDQVHAARVGGERLERRRRRWSPWSR